LQGSLMIFLGVTGFMGPLIFTNTFAWSIGPGAGLGLPGLSILIGAFMIALAFVIAIFVAKPLPQNAAASVTPM
jgi:DHA1 family tetracycline resistance protein-like MFS transporter